ncbi:Mediator complex subunit 17 [Intoshia linei]|uniref:Mediator complex subunit 17 n=1 Tax=Intoshia linei TaxID=1819745 RepID=A0A177B1L6_9BILA|nr:Mediator complex subunit 17 [Intoshia linei]
MAYRLNLLPKDELSIDKIELNENIIYKEKLTSSKKFKNKIKCIQGPIIDQHKEAILSTRSRWNNILENLKLSLTEVCGLLDLLKILRNGKYYCIDFTENEPNSKPQDAENLVELSLQRNVAQIISIALRSGLSTLQPSFETLKLNAEYKSQLLNLCKHWRVISRNDKIYVDVSFRSAGSHFWETGIIEIKRNKILHESKHQKFKLLNAVLPTNLQAVAWILVTLSNSDQSVDNILSFNVSINDFVKTVPSQFDPINTILNEAQNVLFCRELFAVICSECVQFSDTICTSIYENVITCELIGGGKLSFFLMQKYANHIETDEISKDKPSKASRNDVVNESVLMSKMKMCLLKIWHQFQINENMNYCWLPPSRSLQGEISKKQLYACKGKLYRRKFNTDRNQILKTLHDMANHSIIKQIFLQVVDDFECEITDPLIRLNVFTLVSCDYTMYRITFFSVGHPYYKSHTKVKVNSDSIEFFCADIRKVVLRPEKKAIYNFIHTLSIQHLIYIIDELASELRWNNISSSFNRNSIVNCSHLFKHTYSILADPNDSVILIVTINQTSGVRLFIKYIDGNFYEKYINQLQNCDTEEPLNKNFPSCMDSVPTRLINNIEEIQLDLINISTFITKLRIIMNRDEILTAMEINNNVNGFKENDYLNYPPKPEKYQISNLLKSKLPSKVVHRLTKIPKPIYDYDYQMNNIRKMAIKFGPEKIGAPNGLFWPHGKEFAKLCQERSNEMGTEELVEKVKQSAIDKQNDIYEKEKEIDEALDKMNIHHQKLISMHEKENVNLEYAIKKEEQLKKMVKKYYGYEIDKRDPRYEKLVKQNEERIKIEKKLSKKDNKDVSTQKRIEMLKQSVQLAKSN